ncbi:MAG: FtsX-like permease family protein [Clostridia bacterium]|nr:FtsX-like permease family protein [Clostridia bacterium]
MVKRRAGNTLKKKLYRDMSRAAMQFLSIIVLCALGTFAFAALDGMARMTRTTIDTYFEENNLANFWVTLPAGVDRTALDKIRSVDSVEDVIARSVTDLETTLGNNVNVNVTAYDGAMTINTPLLRTGNLLDPADQRGCLIQERFADVQGLTVGDRISVKLGGQEHTFVIRGVVVSPEYVALSRGVAADPQKYGFILINARALPALPLTQAIVTIREGSDPASVQAAIEAALPDALVLNRGAHTSTARCDNDAAMFENMTLIFPILAYAVAGLIVMTTLSRMIDNQRLQMGTLKALGFSAGQIRGHYLSYAVVPSFIGALLGTVIGHVTLPPLLWDALMMQSEMPYRLRPPISLPAWGMVALTVVMSVAICYYTYRKSARETTAALLRPKPPKDGKRILFERITPLWKRLSFNSKMIIRNLMRNKLRTFMSFMGLLACTSLIITSFGLQDSVTTLSYNYYTKTLRYDVRANLTGETGTAQSYERRLNAERVECLMEQGVTLKAASDARTTTLTVLGDKQQLQYLGEDETFITLDTGFLAVTYKLAQTLAIQPGDTVRMLLPGDDEAISMVVSQIAHNNTVQGVYMNVSTWESLRKGDFTPTAIQVLGPGEGCIEELESMDEVDSIDYPPQQIIDMLAMLDALSSVFSLLTIIALALAFVICYNMGLMNFVERIREYATLKVLGYHQKEIRGLILNENMIIAVLGVLGGVFPGYLLTDVVMHSCEPEAAFYPGIPALSSVITACLISFFFSIFIQLLLIRKVRTIDMVEALKSVE